MKKQLLHTPEGVRDIYSEECEKKRVLEERLSLSLTRYGYHPIQTPTFEFFDIFGKEIGTTPSKDLYKFFDREGNTLVLRPDITPSIARAAAKYYMEEDMPLRFCYSGNTFINNSSYQGRLKENTQLGAELIGDGSVDADAEMIAMVADCLQSAGLKEFQISIGHAEFFHGLVHAAGLEEEQEEELRNLISNKNFFGVEEFMEPLNLNENLLQLFQMLGKLYTSSDELSKAKAYAKAYPQILKAVENLEELQEVLELYGLNSYISIEPGMLSGYHYYTGIIFAGYTFGTGEPIVKGGRYDKLLSHFGKESASIGFAIVVDQLMAALSRQKIEIPLPNPKRELIVYSVEKRKEAITDAREKRHQGGYVELVPFAKGKTKEDYETYAGKNRMTTVTMLL